ncbi:MAG: site-2 protease family protein [Gallionellaceae bacterium CG1_02_56_997]|nr:site-2 protease family protein [Gallionella sp.]OIO74586.1 MAG: site-2 protease family protein [Gallionellaceae bacterium CG1_02_56_997]PIV15047.1 MAG: site-2 protease family protein [Gallionellales bacterium CG03_land_8_20_14_0_80_55_15]PJC04530.1 MAG: site-2 protease family protein [Gallionellales bacterium CG_4_9_14_0_8_um_filter_55_61]HCJ50999.1 site-2 protease family protein [Gallionella sp.]
MNELIQTVAIAAIPILFAITLHEAAHGYVARHFGDNTAYLQGRISLNPLRHIDPLGTVLLPLLTLVLGGVLFGWAKPVPVNFGALRNPKKDMLWVALAGPASNLAMAFAWTVLFKFASASPDSYFAEPLMGMAVIGIKINVVLLVLNLLPLPPLDGGRVAVSLLPHRQAYQLSRIEPYGMFILIFLAITPVLGRVLLPLVGLVEKFLFILVGV